MKTAFFILTYLSLSHGIEIVKFDSTGVYFQDLGLLKFSRGCLEFVNTIDIAAIEKAIRHLRASLNSFISEPKYGEAHKKLVDKMISDLNEFKTSMEVTITDQHQGKFLPNMNNEVKNFVNQCDSMTNKLSFQTKPQDKEFIDIEEKFAYFQNILQTKRVDEKLLSVDQLKEELHRTNIVEDPNEIYGKLQNVSKVSILRNVKEIIEVSIKVYILENENYKFWKVIGLPIIKNSNVVSLQNNYKFLLTSESPKFSLGSSNDLGDIDEFQGISILMKNRNFERLDSKSCLSGMFEGNSDSIKSCNYKSSFENIEIFQHLGNYRYLFAIRDPTDYTFTCPGMSHNIGNKDTIQGTGILTLNEGCTFKTEITELKSIKADVILEPSDKYQFSEVFDRIMENLKNEVFKDPPALLPIEKLSTNFNDFHESMRKIEKNQEEIKDLLKELEKPMPTRSSIKWFG
ncbi:hypothetical protein ACFFRR_008939 [Megaselia abdita]